MEEQLSLFDIEPQQMDSVCCGSLHIVKVIKGELPPILECNVTARSLVMKPDAAREVFGISFRRGIIR